MGGSESREQMLEEKREDNLPGTLREQIPSSIPDSLCRQYLVLDDDEKIELDARIQELQEMKDPKIVVGVMGDTNVGKSSSLRIGG